MSNQKRIADSRLKYFLYALVCAVILFFGLVKNGFSSHSWQFWLGQVFLVTAVLWIFILLFSARNKFVDRSKTEFKTELISEFQKNQNDYFLFKENGFTFSAPSLGNTSVQWSDIVSISAWIEDQIVVDDMLCIRLDLKNNKFIEFDEVTPGFFTFVTHCNRILACFPEGWVENLSGMKRRQIELFRQ